MSQRVFLAGASGAIGRRLCPLLIADGWHVTGTTRSPEKAQALRQMGVEPVIVDVFDEAALRRAVSEARPAIVVHQLTDLPALPDPARLAEASARNARIRERAGVTARGVASLEEQVLAAPLEGIVLRYGRLYGPGTGVDKPPSGGPVHVDAAADAARRALEQGARGIYNVAESDGTVVSEKALRDLGWSPAFRSEPVVRS